VTGGRELSLRIGEAAAATGVGVYTLRYYEKENLIKVPRNGSGQRRFGPGDLAAIRFITQLRKTGMPIAMIRDYARTVREGTNTAENSLTLLETHRDAVQSNLAEQQAYLAAINAKINAYRTQLQDGRPLEGKSVNA
jgi:DNA-binding transcriptional MerR regulator